MIADPSVDDPAAIVVDWVRDADGRLLPTLAIRPSIYGDLDYTLTGRMRVGNQLEQWTQGPIELSDSEWTFTDVALPDPIDASQEDWLIPLIVTVEAWDHDGDGRGRALAPPVQIAYPGAAPSLWLASDANLRFPEGRVSRPHAEPLMEDGSLVVFGPPTAFTGEVVEE